MLNTRKIDEKIVEKRKQILEKPIKKKGKITGQVDEKILEKSGKFVSPKKWEP